MSSNPFLDFGNAVVPYARKRKIEKEKAKAAASTPEAKREAEKAKLWDLYIEEMEKRRKVLVSGPYAGTAEALFSFLQTLSFDDGEKLIEMAMVWQSAPRTTRFLVLQIIDEAMINLRERNGLLPFDDPLPPGLAAPDEETENAFLRIQKILS
jgi:hypothetical protein